ncbi:maleylpyruvate isomerase N-terminal domain-containing protein [Micromonospora narathiwatensis]|uniref:TIGR03083 family protein n=1 Tax=Micromonospora narathiwatensis TaxID=299146 RepID=A0A1A8ZX76_9ACTN|nr:maleylpyruvate isomerase N-terminal domain-containing protein [Micromonospora narathiwatensis]SBT48440.1 TIGR03083 family protein [Micromonospora narathiwatensis]
MTVTADDLDAATSRVAAALGPVTGVDWSRPAGALEWDCRHTAEHLGDTLLSYAAQLVARPDDRYVRFTAVADPDASAAQLLEFATCAARMLALVVRATPSGARAFHPAGHADPEGFAAMGCLEVLLHGEDIASGLGVAVDPPRPVCARVVARLFPDVAAGLAEVDPWDGLRWCAGRLALPGRPRRGRWQWRAAPIGG